MTRLPTQTEAAFLAAILAMTDAIRDTRVPDDVRSSLSDAREQVRNVYLFEEASPAPR